MGHPPISRSQREETQTASPEAPLGPSETINRLSERVLAFLSATRTIFDTTNTEKLPELIVQASSEVMLADDVSLLLPRGDGALFIAHSSGLSPEVAKRTTVQVGLGLAGSVAASLQPRLLNGVVDGGHGRAKSSIIYPLASGSRLVGLLTFNRAGERHPFDQEDLALAGFLASQILLALENVRLVRQSTMSEKLAAVGQLAAGIAHEINTPIQFIGDSVHFLRGAIEELGALIGKYQAVCDAVESDKAAAELAHEAREVENEIELEYLAAEIPKALERSQEGVKRVAEIVQAVKTFGRAETREKTAADVNHLVQTVVVVARPEYRHVADLELDLGEIPLLHCHPGDLTQVFLNLIVNASHAIGGRLKEGQRGSIKVRTRFGDDQVIVAVIDDGGGIPKEAQGKIFDPFFTTKEVGKGTGLGLSIARTLVVEKHGGSISFDTIEGNGTTFWVRLPVLPVSEA